MAKNPFHFGGKRAKMSFGRRSVQKVQVVAPPRKRRSSPKVDKLLKKNFNAKLKYCDVISLDAAAATIASHVFRANGIVDCDVTGSGHQPYGSDELKALYKYYQVKRSVIKVTPIATTTSNVVPACWGVYRDTDTTVNHNLIRNMVEDPTVPSNWKIHSGFGSGNPTLSTGGRNTSTKATFSTRNMDAHARDTTLSVSADPTSGTQNDFSYIIYAGSFDGTSNPGSIQFLVEITYWVTFMEPLALTES